MSRAAEGGEGLWTNVHLATMTDGARSYGEIRDGAAAVKDGRIAWVGPERDLPSSFHGLTALDGGGGWLTPGLVDCHTHAVYGGSRSDEFEARLTGVSYEEIARRGGGIRSTMRATRALDEDALYAASRRRVLRLIADGVTTLEIKSGYGLELEAELRMLRVARRFGESLPVRVRTSFLGAHAVPPEFEGRSDDYVRHCVEDMLPAIAKEGMADAVDAFCESIAFSPAQVDQLFIAARSLGLPVKLHAEQLSDQGGAALVASHGGLSADHIEHLSEVGAAAMSAAGTVAVLLPGAFYFLRETKVPPVEALRRHGVRIAVATDLNPGTSPLLSLRQAMNMACVLFRLTPQEALAGATIEAARALGLADDIGSIEVGKAADLLLWDIGRPADLAYQITPEPPRMRMFRGRLT